jgi:hypothetical protein
VFFAVKIYLKWRDGRAQRGNSKEELTQVIVLAQVVYFFANNFLFFQPSFGYICLQQPSFAFTGEVPEEAFGGIFRRPARAAWAG